MIVHINGEKKEIAADLSLAQLLQELGIHPGRVVVELNRAVIARGSYDTTFLKEGDNIEIVHFVGGG